VVVSSPRELQEEFDVAVLATSPEPRMSILNELGGIKAVIVEKPLGHTFDDARIFMEYCQKRDILCQVNLFRRTDKTYRELMSWQMAEQVGIPQAATVLYGNGLLNNGIHMIDLIRMLMGEIVSVRSLGAEIKGVQQIIKDDMNIPCALTLDNGTIVTMHPIDFKYYRDVMIDIWGTKGRLEIYQEGLFLRLSPLKNHRALENNKEVDIDHSINLPSYCGTAYYQLYDDLAKALYGEKEPDSPLKNALDAEAIVQAIKKSYENAGEIVNIAQNELNNV